MHDASDARSEDVRADGPDTVEIFPWQFPSTTTRDEFVSNVLDTTWSFWDGYAHSNPGDTTHHTRVTVAGGAVSLSFVDGEEHNQWWLEHSQLTRAYEGSGVYEIRMNSGIGGHQFGIVFQSEPATFFMFMFYGYGDLWGYVERFVVDDDGFLQKHTFPGPGTLGHRTGLLVPQDGPFILRVAVRDASDPTQRAWKFSWSQDEENWTTVISGVLETSDDGANVGAIREVGFFMGNHPPLPFTGFDAAFDRFVVYPVDLTATASGTDVSLEWPAVTGAHGYRVHRSSTKGGPYGLIGETAQPGFIDDDLANRGARYYMVTAYDGGPAVGYSPEVRVVLDADGG